MIQINLVPGAKKVRGRSAAGAIGDYASAARARVSDPFLTGAVAAVILAVAGIGGTYASHAAREASVGARQEAATADSARYAVMLRERASAVAQRDSVARQLQIIRTIDNDRFVWPHVLDEVSRALPPYTWLTTVEQTSVPAVAPPGGAAADGATGTAADSAARAAAAGPAPLKIRVVGNTVDIQALTRFMKDLEASPFVQNVNLDKSDLVLVEGKEVTQFQLDCEYQPPDAAAIRTVAVSLPPR